MRAKQLEAYHFPLLPDSSLLRHVRAYVPMKFSFRDGGVLILDKSEEVNAVKPKLEGLTLHENGDKRHPAFGYMIADQAKWNDTMEILEKGQFTKRGPAKQDYVFDRKIQGK